jgi:GNAT superfamily N-acetyltransferase
MAESSKRAGPTSSSEPTIVVRPLVAADFSAACRLLAELGRPAVTPDTEDRVRDVFETHIAAGDTASLVAQRGEHVIGLLSLHIRERLSQPAPEAWIPDFVVTEPEQGRGAAQALLARAIEIARERGCHRLVLESHYHRKRAYRFYEREGFADVGKCFSLSLMSPQNP